MGFLLWSLLLLFLPFVSTSYRTPNPLDSNCLYRRSRCLHDSACRLRIIQFDSICGESPTACLASSPSDCVNLLWQMKHWLGDDRCDCHPLFGAVRECDRFRHLLYEHPCETLLNRQPDKEEYRSIGATREYGRRRTTRSPSSIQINEWKKQLSGELFSLATTTQFQSQECDMALNEICLRHVSCSQLWNLFRQNCNVDSDNTCIMQQREACWESFEGLLWTGLGRCHCSSNVSDCHWIRLHTNFNKCIYEISRSSGMSFSSFLPLPIPQPSPPQRVSFVNFASQSLSTPPPIASTTSLPTVLPTHSRVQSTTDSFPIPTITIPRPHEIPTTQSSQRVLNVHRPDDRLTVVQSNHQSSSHTDHDRVQYTQYRTPIPPSHPRRNDDRSLRVNYGNQHDRYSANALNGKPVRVDYSPVPPTVSIHPHYSNRSHEQSINTYRTHEESIRSSHISRQENRQINQDYDRSQIDYRNSDPYRRQESISTNQHNHVPTVSEDRGRWIDTQGQSFSRQDMSRYQQSNHGVQNTPSPDRSHDENYSRSQGNRREEERKEKIRMDERRREENRGEIRDEMGQIIQSNRREHSTRQRGRNQDRTQSSEAPQHISPVTNQERSRDEYQISSRDVSPPFQNPTIIVSSLTNRDKGMEEERRRRKEEEEKRMKEREEKKERDKEERRNMEEKRRKHEENRRERERIEKIRNEEEKKIVDEKIRNEEEKKIVDEKRKEKERDEKRKEKERQEKVAASRNKDNREWVSSSSCFNSLRECESVEECKFQLAELKTRCPRNCDRKQCQGALRRFSSFVPPPLSISLSFCSCPNGDENCPEKELLYPPCIYERTDVRCEHVIEECRREHKCKQLLISMSDECPIVKGACDGGTKCTQLILKARGSIIDTQCTCTNNDQNCLSLQSKMIPNHPCLAESRREYYRLETQESSISLKSEKNGNSMDVVKNASVVVTPSRTRLTTTTEPQLKGEELESAPWLTTITVPTTTTVYTPHAPPPSEGCTLKDSKGRTLFFHVGSILRRNLDWSGRCSSWCECIAEEVLKCHGLPCSSDTNCTSHSPQFTHHYGERLYLKERGPCMCENGDYTCALPPEEFIPELYPGIYLYLGYSQLDIEMLEKEMPSDVYQRAGFLSNKRATDIASQLQIVLESLLPHGLQCRLTVVDQFDSPGNALLRVEWNGMIKRLNQTRNSWQWGMPEKACSKYVRTIEDLFDLGDSHRFQLVLSTVKQMKVHDLLDNVPDSAPFNSFLTLMSTLFVIRYLQ